MDRSDTRHGAGGLRRLGRSAVSGLAVSCLVLPLVAAGCNYSFRGGSFPPPGVETIAIVPFENETARLELAQEVHAALLSGLPSALGVRNAGEEVADAILEGTITGYDVAAPNYRGGGAGDRAEVLQRQVNLTVQVRIVDRTRNVIVWESQGLRAEGIYLEESESEEIGKQTAIELLVQRIVDGVQSNW